MGIWGTGARQKFNKIISKRATEIHTARSYATTLAVEETDSDALLLVSLLSECDMGCRRELLRIRRDLSLLVREGCFSAKDQWTANVDLFKRANL